MANQRKNSKKAAVPSRAKTAAHESDDNVATFAGSDGAVRSAESNGLYRLLVESVHDYAIFAIDPVGDIISWNAGARRIKGYTREEIIGKNFSIFYLPDELAAGKPQWELEVAAAEGRVEVDGWRVRKDGSRFWANVIITALWEGGKLVGYAKVTRDLTERRAAEESLRVSEERFRLIVQSVRDYGIFMLDPAGNVASWNEGARRIKGYNADEIIGKHFSTFYPEEDNRSGKPAWELRVASAEGRFEDEGWRVRKDGSLFWANVIITALRNHLGELVGFAKVTRDLTERKAAEERAIADARRIARAEASDRTKSEFLAAMSHELRTPLNAIGGYAELMEMGVAGEVSPKQVEYLDRIRNAQQHLLALINDLLNYGRIESGQVTYDVESVKLHGLVEGVLDMVKPQATLKGLTTKHERCTENATAFADRLKVEQIVLNLLSNAVKFTDNGGEVSVACAQDGDRAYVEVRDTGMGIPEDKQDAIFEPFVQLGRSLTATREGSGLGLAISRDLARGMGGDVTVTSAPGKGSTFRLTLRIA